MPKQIKVTGTIYEYDEEWGFYFTKNKNGRVALGGKLDEINLIYNFNSENIVEIIEEDKKIEKMTPLNNVSGASDLVAISSMQWENNLKIERKINEIIDKLNEMEKE